jgi:colicin import membrane protein
MEDPPTEEMVNKEKDVALKADIGRLEGTVQGLKQIIKDFTFQFGEDNVCTTTVQTQLQSVEGRLRELREERRSGVPVAELRRRAEKDRDLTIAKLERTTNELKEADEQQDKLNKRKELLWTQQAEQTSKLERLKQQVAELAQDEAGTSPEGEKAADKPQPKVNTSADTALEGAAEARRLAEEAARATAGGRPGGLELAARAMQAAADASTAARKAHAEAADQEHIRVVAEATATAKAEDAAAAASAAAAAKRQQDEAAQEEVKKARLA